MFDNLRDSASPFYEEEPIDTVPEPTARPAARRRRRNSRFLGMTSQQRFFLSLIFMLTVCVMGVLVMFVLGKMAIF